MAVAAVLVEPALVGVHGQQQAADQDHDQVNGRPGIRVLPDQGGGAAVDRPGWFAPDKELWKEREQGEVILH